MCNPDNTTPKKTAECYQDNACFERHWCTPFEVEMSKVLDRIFNWNVPSGQTSSLTPTPALPTHVMHVNISKTVQLAIFKVTVVYL